MKQMIRYISVFVLLMCSMASFAASKVEIAGTTNGTITSSLSGQTCTLTVTPASGYYIRKGDITVQKTVIFGSSTRGDIPVADNLTLSGDDPAALSAVRTYTFVIPEGYNAYVTATFTACTAVTLTASIEGWTFGETVKTPSVTGNTGNATVAYTYATKGSTSFSATVPTAAGNYTVKASVSAIGIYTAAEATADFTITKADGSLTAPTAVSDLEYSGKAQALISAGSSTTGTIQYSLDGTTYGTDLPTGTDAKEYTVYYKSVGDKNHNDVAAASLKVSIAPKAVTVTAEDKSKVYGADDPTLTATVSGTVGTDKVDYTLSRAEGSDVGEYTITASGNASQGNYSVSFVDAKFTITKADGSLTAPKAVSDLEYSGKAQTLISAGSSTTGTIQYSLNGTTYGTDLPTGTDAKEYTLYYKSVGDKNHNDVAAASLKVTIAPKSVTVTAEDKTKVYGADDPTLTATVAGTIGTDVVIYTLGRAEGSDVGEYAITASGDKAQGNYTVTYTGAKFTITKADGSLTAPTAVSDLIYSGKAQALISAGSSTTGTIQYSLDGTTYGTDLPTGTDAKEYTVYYKSVGDKNHNDVAAASLKVTIAPKSVTVTAEDKTKVYGADDPTLTATVAGTIGTDKVIYKLSRAEGSDVGEYTITASGNTSQGNYSVTYTGAKFTITKADGSLTAPTAVSDLIYSGKAQALISAGSSTTGTIQYSLDGTTYGTDLPTGTDAKEYTVYYKSVGDKNHNDVAAASLKVTIAPKSVTVTAEDKTKVEGEADPELTAKVEGLIGTDKVAYTLSRDKGETVGEYTITASGDAAQGNYAVTFVGAKLTITAKPKPSGDVNGDGVVNIVDVVALSKAIIAGSTDEKYDINGDGSINAKDITALVALIAAI